MLEHACSGGADIHFIEGFAVRPTVKGKGLHIDAGDHIIYWYPPKFCLWTAPAFEDSSLGNGDLSGAVIVYVDIQAVADVEISGIDELAATEERSVCDVWGNIYGVCCFTQVVFEESNDGSWSRMSGSQVKTLGRLECCRDEITF